MTNTVEFVQLSDAIDLGLATLGCNERPEGWRVAEFGDLLAYAHPECPEILGEVPSQLIARNLTGVSVGDTLTVRNGEVFKGDQKVSTDLTRRVAPDGECVVRKKSGAAPGDVGYYTE